MEAEAGGKSHDISAMFGRLMKKTTTKKGEGTREDGGKEKEVKVEADVKEE